MNPMTEVMRYRRLKAKDQQTQQDQIAIDSTLATLFHGQPTRVKRNVAQTVLLGSPWLFNGKNMNITAKSVGAGIYELTSNNT